MSAAEEIVEQAVKSPKEVEIVTMSDGRKVEFAGKRQLLKTSVPSEEGGPAVILDFRNGASVRYQIPPTLLERFALHGAEQKLGDETAGTKDVDDMQLDVEALIERLDRGEWSIKREGGGMAGTSILLKALVEYGGKSVEEVKAYLKDKSHNDKLAMRGSTRKNKHGISRKEIVERLESEKLAKGAKVDTDALLAGIEA